MRISSELGTGISRSSETSGPPTLWTTIARIFGIAGSPSIETSQPNPYPQLGPNCDDLFRRSLRLRLGNEVGLARAGQMVQVRLVVQGDAGKTGLGLQDQVLGERCGAEFPALRQ